MPHSTRPADGARDSSLHFKFPNDIKSESRTSMEPFPDHVDSVNGQFPYPPSPNTLNSFPVDRRNSRRDSSLWGSARNGQVGTGGRGHGRQQSLSDAIRTIRTRRGSVSANLGANLHDVGDALKAPLSPKLIILCIIWYLSSALTNTSSKSILNTFDKPVTLTLIQFAFVSSSCIFCSWLSTIFPTLKTRVPPLRNGILYPTKELVMTTIPMSLFVLGGHLLSATATAKIPVSTVHTIKGLSPLITVAAYRLIYNLSYPIYTYLSLIPLTLGVMLACSADFRGNIFGITFAFLSTIVFVAQNIFSKRLFNEAAATEASGIPASRMKKPDKLNLLCYSSGLAFLLTAPIWFWSEGITILGDFLHDGSLDLITHEKSLDHGRLALEFVFNGVTHFGQNILAFVLLSMVSPVTYSVASLIKRVFVIILAIFWFGSHLTRVQWVGVLLTFIGLYLYDRTSQNKAERKARMMTVKEEPVLPLTNRDLNISGSRGPSPVNGTQRGYTNDYALKPGIEDKKSDDPPGRGGRVRATSSANRGLHGGWMPPGTKQEETWRPNLGDLNGNNGNGAKISVS